MAIKDTLSGAFPSLGVAEIFPEMLDIFAPSINADVFDIASPTFWVESGFFMAISRYISTALFAVAFSVATSVLSGSRS